MFAVDRNHVQSVRRISLAKIDGIVSARLGTTRVAGNAQPAVFNRQIAMYLAKELTPASLPEIGRAFSGKHHTTVLHSIQKIDQLRQRDPDLNSLIHSLVDSIH